MRKIAIILVLLFIGTYGTTKPVSGQDLIFVRATWRTSAGVYKQVVLDVTARARVVTVTNLIKTACDDTLQHEQRILTLKESTPVIKDLAGLVRALFLLKPGKKPAKTDGYLEFWFGMGKRFGRVFVKPAALAGSGAPLLAWIWLKNTVAGNARLSFYDLFQPEQGTGVLNVLTAGNDPVIIDGWLHMKGPTLSLIMPFGRHRVELENKHESRTVFLQKDLTVTVDFTQ